MGARESRPSTGQLTLVGAVESHQSAPAEEDDAGADGSSCCSSGWIGRSSKPEEDLVPFRGTGGSVHMLIVALNYEYVPSARLTCWKDAVTMHHIAERAGVQDIVVVTDKKGVGSPNFPTRSVVLKKIREVGGRCKPGDWFVWFWAGHGVNVPDYEGDEASGMDQAFVTPDERGRLTESAVLIDDEFAMALDAFVPLGVRILCICDCCHSGSICDIDSFNYRHEIYQISASQDMQEAEDIGKGGVLSTALRRAVRQLSVGYGNQEFSLAILFKVCRQYALQLANEKDQKLSFQFCGTHPTKVAWPLAYPWWEYLQTHASTMRILHSDEEDEESLERADGATTASPLSERQQAYERNRVASSTKSATKSAVAANVLDTSGLVGSRASRADNGEDFTGSKLLQPQGQYLLHEHTSRSGSSAVAPAAASTAFQPLPLQTRHGLQLALDAFVAGA